MNFLHQPLIYFPGKRTCGSKLSRAASLTGNLLLFYLKVNFFPDFDDEIWDDIKSRKQGRSEPTVIFIAVMETLFSRLSRPPVDSTKVKFIRRNLLPQYLSQLTLFETDRVEELVKCCEKLENAAFVKCL